MPCPAGGGSVGGRGGQKGGFGADVAAALAAELDALAGAGEAAADFGRLETAARRCALRVAARAVAERYNADRSDERPAWRCGCGGEARDAGRRDKTFTTVLGTLTLARAYYWCRRCRAGFRPRDRALGLDAGSLSPGVRRMVGSAAAASFAATAGLLHDLAGVAVDAKQAERAAEALGAEIADDERREVIPEPPPARTMYLGMDGTGIPVRPSETVGRAGKQPDGSAKTREVKLVSVWTAEGRDARGVPQRDAGSVSYSAAIESAATPDTDRGPSAFAGRVAREARRRGFDRAERRVVLGDGARWIWNIAEEMFPGAIRIVDLFHAKERLWDVAKAVYGADGGLGERWARRLDELDGGRLDDLLATLDILAASSEEARKCRGYVRRYRHRMRYPEFRAAGLCVSSGVLEAGCKHAIGTRMKRGMHWTVAGGDAIVALRCCKVSDRYPDFWARRSTAA